MEYLDILKIIEGECTPDEKRRFFKQLSEDKLLEQEYIRIKNEYVLSTLPNNPTSTVSVGRKKRKYNIIPLMTKIAAVMSIPFLLYFVLDIIKENDDLSDKKITEYKQGVGVKYSVNPGVKASFILSDSTKVWLNSGSYLNIPSDFNKDNRIVSLSGEGFFDVQSDSISPFIIHTPQNIKVKVTGTEFNLSCYEDDKNMKVTLLKGALQLIQQDSEAIEIKPDEQIIIEYKSLVNKLDPKADTEYATAWKSGFLRFIDTPFDEVIRKLERWYGVNIALKDQSLLEHRFTADFESESIIQVLDLLSIIMPISYKIEGNNVVLYTKQ